MPCSGDVWSNTNIFSIFGDLVGQSYKKGGTTLKGKKKKEDQGTFKEWKSRAKIKGWCRLLWPCPSHQSAYCLPSILMIIIVKQLVYIIRPLVNKTNKLFVFCMHWHCHRLIFFGEKRLCVLDVGSGSALVTDRASYAHCNQLHLHLNFDLMGVSASYPFSIAHCTAWRGVMVMDESDKIIHIFICLCFDLLEDAGRLLFDLFYI